MIRKCLSRRFCRLLFIFFISLIVYLGLIVNRSSEKNAIRPVESNISVPPSTQTSSPLSPPPINAQSPKLVLVWTDLFDDPYWHQPSYFNTSMTVSCSAQHRCQFTRDRERRSEASAVAFHLYDINRSDLPERDASKMDNQTWIFVTGESPVNFYYQNPSFFPQLLDHYFDRSISYRHDSPFSIFSSSIKPRQSVSVHETQMNQASLKTKSKPIVWMVSNCATFSEREKYVDELKKFIPVDIYGSCGTTCSQNEQQRCSIDLSEYYFYLSFENSRCNSYITEKFWKIISSDDYRLVPIVMGPDANDYARIAPKQSYIHVDTYQTPENLARYLRSLIDQPDEYLRYLQWRTLSQLEPITANRWSHLLCPICQMAHQTPQPPSARLQFSSWFNPAVECHRNDLNIFNTCKQATLKVWMSWIHSLKCP